MLPTLHLQATALALAVSATTVGAAIAAPSDMTVDAAIRKEVISNTVQYLKADYVFPDVATKMAADLQARQKRGEYDQIVSALRLAEQLTTDMQAISHDKHLRVRYREEAIAEDKVEDDESPEEIARYEREAKGRNYGFRKVEMLDGNIGYLRLDNFEEPAIAGPTATAAMTFLSSASAVIIDLRSNGGGSPEMVQWLTSYLFSPTPVHLNDLYYRPQNATTQYWTHAYVPGPRLSNTPVYVLTAKRTFSAAEEFSYNLKNLKRATLVGETTGGGAHPGRNYRVQAHFQVFVATGRAINPISKTNWEGSGVTPDVAVTATDALTTAHKLALEATIKNSQDADNRKRAETALAKLAQ
ncbi:S41 family peptidase [Chitinimonas sp.]|uniref:S41 family peptidase n=1 Tax=Chitinimonas sp. TaxID=1934313 RepID=UPI002F9549DE